MKRALPWLLAGGSAFVLAVSAAAQSLPVSIVECDLFIAGGGLGGVAAAIEALGLGKKVCMSEITDWLGGQASQQGVSALDERPLQRSDNGQLFPRGYSQFRAAIRSRYKGERNPGRCWVSELCFSPQIGAEVLRERLAPFVATGQLVLLTDTVVKDLDVAASRIEAVTTITHVPKDPATGVNSRPLSQFLLDWYDPAPSALFDKRLTRFVPPAARKGHSVEWMVIDATETGELLPLAGVPYRLGTDRQNRWEPDASPEGEDPYCIQGFTYPFVMEQTAQPQAHTPPPNYDSPYNGGYYSYEKPQFSFASIFTYRRIWGAVDGTGVGALSDGDQSMQNWTFGNDWRLSTGATNLIFTESQLRERRQLLKGQWQGGLRPEALQRAEEHALGYFYWLVAGQSDSQLRKVDPNYQKPLYPNYRFLRGALTPMGTDHGLSRYPYIREGRRLVGRPSIAYPFGFTIYQTDISRARQDPILNPGRPFIYLDAVGISQYPIDFHGCIVDENFDPSPFEAKEAPAPSFPYQLPLRALIPQKIDNLLAGNKNIATSHITNGSYRVHPIEWAIGAAAGNTAAFALERDWIPARIVAGVDRLDYAADRELRALQRQIVERGNPIAYPGTTIFDTKWADYK
ncbi:FAD-dependent oxidoreductase [Gloeobacter kilaueensis]|uniref:Pyruvate/2-oxoglutarate dehydrogenase complex, dihydrolipoamide dehydrogenase (E3) component,-related enzyme n=1 Tax=Gloeobacter kilaueensis (strain ATCC BAA-2537 / CCAP 1431/1 / ULC 316 / JS1) TaxID=1183438 RepID=U5QJ94_GLOK1|nr:FAD-dependent oxidoreductase [Gloeobacter kilaueensis]AGY58933.1 pyruvate/2-oxoglutarate dehydrogenase complex, dihydrolipoamide dehydrogenase (E3) component,-related enzyme [Gloeobacter kilaueensis JS1]